MKWEWSESERKLFFNGTELVPDVRTLEQMRPVLFDERANGPEDLYYMYRDVSPVGENIRYDITVIPPAMYGREYVKTKGHFHPKKGLHTYPEIYEVLEGKAKYLLQSESQLIVFSATKGEQVLIPPGFGHVTINSSRKTLAMSNWVSSEFSSDYGPFLEKRGAAHYLLGDGWAENPLYTGVSISFESPGKGNWPHFSKQKSMYDLFFEDKNIFSFLNNPDLCFVL